MRSVFEMLIENLEFTLPKDEVMIVRAGGSASMFPTYDPREAVMGGSDA